MQFVLRHVCWSLSTYRTENEHRVTSTALHAAAGRKLP